MSERSSPARGSPPHLSDRSTLTPERPSSPLLAPSGPQAILTSRGFRPDMSTFSLHLIPQLLIPEYIIPVIDLFSVGPIEFPASIIRDRLRYRIDRSTLPNGNLSAGYYFNFLIKILFPM
jgi:hypothetical protein